MDCLCFSKAASFLLFSLQDVFPISSKFLLQKFGSTVHKEEKQSQLQRNHVFILIGLFFCLNSNKIV